MRVIVIREIVDPEERKLRLHKIAKYARRHGHHAISLYRQVKGLGKMGLRDPGHAMRRRKADILIRQAQPHKRRYYIAKGIIKKFQAPKGSLERKRRSDELKRDRRVFK